MGVFMALQKNDVSKIKKNLKKKSDSNDSIKIKKANSKDKNKLFKVIGYVMLFFVVLILLIIWIKYKAIKQSNNIDGLYQEVLDGKESANGYMYKGFVFVKLDDLWYTKLQKGNTVFTAPFHYSPREVEYVPIEGDILSFGRLIMQNYSNEFYITFNPKDPKLKYIALSNGELSFNVVQTFDLKPTVGCTVNETQGCYLAPIITCENADKPVIYFRYSTETKVISDKNCLIIQGDEVEMLKATDKLLFTWYKIIV